MAAHHRPQSTRRLLRRLTAQIKDPKPLLERGKVALIQSLDAHGLRSVSLLLFKAKRSALRWGRPGGSLGRVLPRVLGRMGWARARTASTPVEPLLAMELLPEDEVSSRREALLERKTRSLVSVVMPTWNRAAVLEAAIQSVLDQSYRTLELLVVDDGSTDQTRDLVQKLQAGDPRVRYFRTEHEGVSAARNVALQHARGAFVAYLDSDNSWHPDYLLHMLHGLLDSGKLTAYCGQRIIDAEGREPPSRRLIPFDSARLRQNNYIDINVFMHRRELFEALGGFDTALRRWVDWDLILRYTTYCEPLQLPIVLGNYCSSERLNQITFAESPAQKNKVLNKHLVAWRQLEVEAPLRERGLVSIVIPVFNQARLTERCLQSIFAFTEGRPLEVVVVDNASTDHTSALLRILCAKEERLSVVANYENYGFALACNLGVANSLGEYVVLLNNDTEVTPRWLEVLISTLEEDPRIGIVGPKLLFPDQTLQSGGMVFSSHSKIPYNIYQGFPGGHPAVNRARHFQAVTGACWALRAEDYIALRGFDAAYLNGGEDIDFCFRLTRDLGKRIFYNPRSVVYHYEGRTEGRGKNIMANRRLLVEQWREQIVADDQGFFAEDGFQVEEYFKKGTEPHGETAAYYPVFAPDSVTPASDAPAATTGPASVDRQVVQLLELPCIAPRIERRNPRRMLRVGFSSIWHARGISFHTKQLADSLEGRGFETHIFARWESDRFQNDGPIHHPRVFNGGDDPTPEVMLQWVRENDLDLVVFMEVHPKDWKRVQRLKSAGIRLLCYENLDVLRLEAFDRYAAFDAFLFNTFNARDVFMRRFPEARAVTLPWGVDLPYLGEHYRPADPNDLQWLHVAGWGGLNNRKNTGLVLEAFQAAAIPNATLRLYTQAPLHSYGREVSVVAEANPRIQVVEGTVADIMQAYRGVDLLLFPSKREGLGLPIVEALAHGVPVLTTNGFMMKQWAIPEKHCVLCPADEQPGMMYLPEMLVGREPLVSLLKRVASDARLLTELKLNVFRDRNLWRWTWQPDTLAELLRGFIEGDALPEISDLSYLPEPILAHERFRAQVDGTAPP